jgi:ABC-2 type transport system ATP-binding protein
MMEAGKIERNATTEEYLKSLDGYVWVFDLPADELDEFQKKAVISNMIPKGDKLEVRVVDEKKPSDNAVPAIPTMEDVYLYVFNYLTRRDM